MRNDAQAKERRRQRAQERQTPAPSTETVTAAKYPTPDSPKAMIAFARSLGWEVIKTRDGYRLHHPDGDTACMHLSVSDKAAWRNLRSQILRPVRRGSISD